MIDKIEHFFVTTFITVFVGYLPNIIFGVFLAFLFSVLKELYDFKIQKEDFEAKDMIADVLGIIFGVLIMFLISRF
jgi:MFS superfamily sulfate permease-like transporter